VNGFKNWVGKIRGWCKTRANPACHLLGESPRPPPRQKHSRPRPPTGWGKVMVAGGWWFRRQPLPAPSPGCRVASQGYSAHGPEPATIRGGLVDRPPVPAAPDTIPRSPPTSLHAWNLRGRDVAMTRWPPELRGLRASLFQRACGWGDQLPKPCLSTGITDAGHSLSIKQTV